MSNLSLLLHSVMTPVHSECLCPPLTLPHQSHYSVTQVNPHVKERRRVHAVAELKPWKEREEWMGMSEMHRGMEEREGSVMTCSQKDHHSTVSERVCSSD